MLSKIIWIIDFGSQYTPIIERRMRECGYSYLTIGLNEYNETLSQEKNPPKGIIFSGGPQSVYEENINKEIIVKILNSNIPILGICFGLQLLVHFSDGKIQKGPRGEYGNSIITQLIDHPYIKHWPKTDEVWMSHGDEVIQIHDDFQILYKNQDNIPVVILHRLKPWLAFQFHPEVFHTKFGIEYLKTFLDKILNHPPDKKPISILDLGMQNLQTNDIENSYILCAFSGGVDSLVAAMMTSRIAKDKLICFFVNHGLVRPQDERHIKLLQEKTKLQIIEIKAHERFLKKLEGISEPEVKRKIIGHEFIATFEDEVNTYAKEHNIHFDYLLQGTLYPDVIESMSILKKDGTSSTIKSHHNVGGLPERMKLKLLEPLREFFKDEVREIGVQLGLDPLWVNRHPFPGPGIGIRIMGEITPQRTNQVRQSDEILYEEMIKFDIYNSIWQALTILLPVKTVGVKGDKRVYEEVICIRLIQSHDGMTAHWVDVPNQFLRILSNRITNEVNGITRVVYDITDKPPGTIEWE